MIYQRVNLEAFSGRFEAFKPDPTMGAHPGVLKTAPGAGKPCFRPILEASLTQFPGQTPAWLK